jgi:glycosidase
MEFPPDRAVAHLSFPLTFQALTRSSLTPEFNYSETSNARIINARLWPSYKSFSPAEFITIGLIGKSFLRIIENYQETSNPSLYLDLDDFFLGFPEPSAPNRFLHKSLEIYPTSLSYYSPDLVSSYLFSNKNTPHNRYSLYNSLLLINNASNNPSIRKFDNIFTDPAFINSLEYQNIFKTLEEYFRKQPTYEKSGMTLLDLLAAPSKAHPDSLENQLSYIRLNWSDLLGLTFITEVLKTLDLLREENKPSFSSSGPVESPLFYSEATYLSDQDQIRFSHDQDWMPNLILIAKNVFVWLDQLSNKYQKPIYRLDQIPDEELALLSTWGITGLWLIGIWERSSASQKIKQICGNRDAIPSAYSLYDYSIADVLGGESAYQVLSGRALAHGIRLAADMVPNHMGIYSNWVIEHPDRFLSLDNPPFPNYVYSGPNLSEDSRVGIYIDDHYYNQTDAAVVFKRVDLNTGTESYIYHGNDGTAMPWNDTAQLNFLNADTREAVIQAILHVARKFPVIRFDAAMTLAKKHYQRLWFPEPGSGGAIPTRSEHGMSKEQFDFAMPTEFWQEVVDRVADEAPDTLLLAEAFWMMESYFVRSLGMHRVYNSAFMHMLRDEDNQKYRDLIIKTLEFDPQILKRYANFMNNPDEETALVQFGSNGKYFGICILMSTLPGLPMFGHGQIEGYSEKYGMEYRRAYRDEKPDQEMINRHAKEIFPLLKKRHLFSDVKNFCLFDVVSSDGKVNENVFAYSNRRGTEGALVIYHNKLAHAEGIINQSTPINGNSISLLDALELGGIEADYLLFREHITGLEFIRPIAELLTSGLEISLGAYQCQVFLDFKLVSSSEDSYQQLHQSLKGSGTVNLQDDLLQIRYDSLLSIILELIRLFPVIYPVDMDPSLKISGIPNSVTDSLKHLIESINKSLVEICQSIPEWKSESKVDQFVDLYNLIYWDASLNKSLTIDLLFFILFKDCRGEVQDEFLQTLARLLDKRLSKTFPNIAPFIWDKFKVIQEINSNLNSLSPDTVSLTKFWFNNQAATDFMAVHKFQGQSWFNKEAFEELLDLTLVLMLMNHRTLTRSNNKSNLSFESTISGVRQLFLDLLPRSNYLVDSFINLAEGFGEG